MERETIRVLFLGADSPAAARLAASLAQAESFALQMHWVEALEEGLECLGEEAFDVAVVGSEHSDLCREFVVKALGVRPSLAVLVCTTEADRELGQAALEAGAADHLVLGDEEQACIVRAVQLGVSAVAHAELRERQEAIEAGARDALWEWDLRSDSVRFTARFAEMLGLESTGSLDTPDAWFRRVHPNDIAGLRSAITDTLGGQRAVCEVEYRARHADGTYRWVACRGSVRRDAAGPTIMAGSHSDVHEFKSGAGRRLSELFRDPLTGLPSRALFVERVGRALARMRIDSREIYAVVVLDLDRFHKINEALGHAAGDQLLTEVTSRLATCVHEGDTLSRLGSDKFGILLEAPRRSRDVLQVIEKVIRSLEPAIAVEGEEVFPSAGIGLALGAARYEKAEDVMSDAFSAMHRAKERGGGEFEIFDPEQQARTMDLLRLESDLGRAIERSEFCLHYQPIVEMTSERIAGFEALIRWNHPERGLVAPGAFVPLAEETGLISEIGGWVLEEACKTSRRWNERFANGTPLGVSINLSGRQFSDPDLARKIEDAINRHELDPRALKLEITESVLMENSAQNAEQLHRLRALGLELMIDDFGTGYSSLSSLHRFPIETLKIDRTFVNRMEFEEENSEIVKTIMTLGQNLDMTVVAEGVETQAQLEALRELGCDMGQGFLFSNAVDLESAEAWLESLPRS